MPQSVLTPDQAGVSARCPTTLWWLLRTAADLALLLAVFPHQTFAANPQQSPYCDSSGAVSSDTCYGLDALQSESGGGGNSAFGYQTLQYNTNGEYNSAAGLQALNVNTSGSYNTAVGEEALSFNTTGSFNTATGMRALTRGQTGSYNTADGYQALYLGDPTTVVNGETATGYQALYSDSSGAEGNVADGYEALQNNAAGQYNTGSGYQALQNNAGGAYNTGTGYQALNANTGANNTATGAFALLDNTTGVENTADGESALETSTGNYDTASGYSALGFLTTGSGDTALGFSAGQNAGNADTTGSNNTFVGYEAGPGTSTQLDNATAIGANAVVSENNALVLGASGTDVGIGTATPDQPLTVVGSVHIISSGSRGSVHNSAPLGIEFPDGTLQSMATSVTAAPGTPGTYLRSNGNAWVSSTIQAGDVPAGSNNYIQDSSAQQASANFNISGNGTLGGTLSSAAAGIGISGAPNSLLQVGVPGTSYGSYLQIPEVTSASSPPASACTAATYGRLVLEVVSTSTYHLWGCGTGGWKKV